MRSTTALLGLLILGCSGNGMFEPENSVPYEPLPEHRIWWEECVACTGHTPGMRVGGRWVPTFDEIQWRIVLGVASFECGPGDTWCFGVYNHSTRTLTLAEAYLLAEPNVKHELLHALEVDSQGEAGREVYLRCGAVWFPSGL